MTMVYSATSEHFSHPLNIFEDALWSQHPLNIFEDTLWSHPRSYDTASLFNSEIPPIGVYDNQWLSTNKSTEWYPLPIQYGPQNSAPPISRGEKWWQTVLEREISCSSCTHE
jgi:hypothetical protein